RSRGRRRTRSRSSGSAWPRRRHARLLWRPSCRDSRAGAGTCLGSLKQAPDKATRPEVCRSAAGGGSKSWHPGALGTGIDLVDNRGTMADDTNDAATTVLVVEDDFDLRDALVPILEYEGHRVVSAANGREALDWLHAMPPPSLILLDLMMPVMNGEEFRAEQLRDP